MNEHKKLRISGLFHGSKDWQNFRPRWEEVGFVPAWKMLLSWLLLLLFGLPGCTVSSEITAGTSNDRGVVATSTPPVSSQPDPSDQLRNTVRNEVNGIGIGSTYKELTKQFGKAVSEKKGGENPCGSRKTVLQYKGIAFTMDDDGENNFVVLIEITSPNWEIVPGIRTGFTVEQVRSKMGRNGMLTIDEGVEWLGYGDGDGYLRFYLKDGKVTKITRELNMC